jgi:hypothetical protein
LPVSEDFLIANASGADRGNAPGVTEQEMKESAADARGLSLNRSTESRGAGVRGFRSDSAADLPDDVNPAVDADALAKGVMR